MSAVTADLHTARPRSEDRVIRAGHRSTARGAGRLGAPTPWRGTDLVVAAALALVGAIVVAVGWNGASREAAFRDQIGWTVAAIGGVGIFALGGGFWLLVGFRRTRQCRAQLRADFDAVYGPAGAVGDTGAPTGPGTEPAVVTAPGMRLGHRPDCLLVRGKAVREVRADAPEAFGSCAMCRP